MSIAAPIFRILVRDPVSGAVITPDLPHRAAGATFEVLGYQLGMKQPGTFTIALWPARSPLGRQSAMSHARLSAWQRVEWFAPGQAASARQRATGLARK